MKHGHISRKITSVPFSIKLKSNEIDPFFHILETLQQFNFNLIFGMSNIVVYNRIINRLIVDKNIGKGWIKISRDMTGKKKD